jgi:hypothetical protein
MSQAGYTPIQLYFSTTAAAVPVNTNLANGELAINITDEKLYFKNAAGVVKLLASNAGSTGTVSSVAQSFTGGLISVAGSPITTSGTLALTVAGTSGGIPYFSSGTTWASSAALAANSLVIGGGAGAAPSTTTTGTGVVTALGVNVGTAGAFVVNGGALGTPSSGTVTYLTGTASININGTVGATTPTTGAFTTVTENGYAVVSQADIGTADNEIPLNQYLGSMAYQNGTDFYNTGMTVGFRNRIINGAMVIDQRNAGASVTPTDGAYTLDRWVAYLTAASKFSVQQNAGAVTPPTGFTNYLGVTSLSAYSVSASDYFVIAQRIEGFNTADLAWGTANAQTVVLSFWIRSSLTGAFGGTLMNNAGTQSYPFTYTISSANTWELKSIVIAGSTTGTWLTTTGRGVQVQFGLGIGSNFVATTGAWASSEEYSSTGATSVVGTNGATWYITGVQLEKGSTATSFDVRPYGTELSLCQRYYWRAVNGNSQVITNGFYYSNSDARGVINFPCTMRSAPSLVSSSGTDHFRIQSVSADDTFNTFLDAGPTSTTAMYLYINSNVSGTAGTAGAFISNNASASLAFSSEL